MRSLPLLREVVSGPPAVDGEPQPGPHPWCRGPALVGAAGQLCPPAMSVPGTAWAQASWLLGGPGALSSAEPVLAEGLCSSAAANSPGALCPEVLPWHPPGWALPASPGGSAFMVVSAHTGAKSMGFSSCCSVNWTTFLTAFLLCVGSLDPPQGVVAMCILGHHVLLSRIWPHERKVQPHRAEAALGRGPSLLKPPRVGSVAVANKVPWGASSTSCVVCRGGGRPGEAGSWLWCVPGMGRGPGSQICLCGAGAVLDVVC